MVKLVQVSDDAEANWYTLPGGSGSISREAGDISDTIFGQTFSSSESGLLTASISANGLYKGFAGYVADIFGPDPTTAMTDEAMTLVSGKTYQITDAVKRLIDRGVTIIVKDNAIDETANVLDINYLYGEVTFLAAYTPNTPITITGSYFPLIALGKARNFTLTQTADAIETTDFPTAQANGGYRTWDPGLRTVALDLGGVYSLTDNLKDALLNRTELMIVVNPDGNLLSQGRGFFKVAQNNQSGDVGALEEVSDALRLQVPIEESNPAVNTPFEWRHDGATTLAQAIQVCLEAWQSETKIDAQYLFDGVNGDKGGCIVTDVSLTSGLEAMNEFNATLMIDGALTAVP